MGTPISSLDQCTHCGRVIDELEVPMVWNDAVVCARCHDKLASQSAPSPVPAPAARPGFCQNCGRAIGVLETSYLWKGQHIVCNECRAKLVAPRQVPAHTLPKAASSFDLNPARVLTTLAILAIMGLIVVMLLYKVGIIESSEARELRETKKSQDQMDAIIEQTRKASRALRDAGG